MALPVNEMMRILRQMTPEEQCEVMAALKQIILKKTAETEPDEPAEEFSLETVEKIWQTRSNVTVPAWFTGQIRVRGITLLSRSQLKAYRQNILPTSFTWWLLDTARDHLGRYRHSYGKRDLSSAWTGGISAVKRGVRPLVILEEQSTLCVGDQFLLNGFSFHMISGQLALCDTALFQEEYPTRFDVSVIKRRLEQWLKKQYSAYKVPQKRRDVVRLGTFCQGAGGEVLPVEWYVIRREDDKILLLSRDILAVKAYDETLGTWEESSLKRWLNDNFCTECFSEEEKAQLLPAPTGSLGSSEELHNPVFLLSSREVKRLAPHHLFAENSLYIISGRAGEKNTNNSWWCRDKERLDLYYVRRDGKPQTANCSPGYSFGGYRGVRPAVWVKAGYVEQRIGK